jgi:hypothetical protein
MSTKKRKTKVRILTRAEILKKIGLKVASQNNNLVDAKARNPPPKIDPAFIQFKTKGSGRLKPGTGSNRSPYRKK